MKALIGRLSQENPLWGTERIRGELLKLGIAVSNRTIRRYRWRRPRPGDQQRWRTFLANQLVGTWATDLFVVQTGTFRTLYVLFFIKHERRQPLDVTASPSAAWIWQQLLEATPWTGSLTTSSTIEMPFMGVTSSASWPTWDRRVAHPAPGAESDAVAERIVRTIRTECLDHVIVINERHLRGVLAEFADYYNRDRPHRGLRLETPAPGAGQETLRWGTASPCGPDTEVMWAAGYQRVTRRVSRCPGRVPRL